RCRTDGTPDDVLLSAERGGWDRPGRHRPRPPLPSLLRDAPEERRKTSRKDGWAKGAPDRRPLSARTGEAVGRPCFTTESGSDGRVEHDVRGSIVRLRLLLGGLPAPR